MKSSIERTGYIFLLFFSFILVLTGFIKPTPPAVPATLGVPFVNQMGNFWCWAACTEMVTTYLHSKDPTVPIITQCQAVKDYLGDSTMTCPMTMPIASNYDVAGIPFSPTVEPAFSSGTYIGPQYTNGAIPYDSLEAQIAAGNPVIFCWNFVGITPTTAANSGYHYMVAEGCPVSPFVSDSLVSINDPLPPGLGHHRIIEYSEYANISYGTAQSSQLQMFNSKYIFNSHGGDITNIRYIGK